jgi:putative hydrolase of the HAD superfamily
MIKAILFDWGGVLIANPEEGLMKYCAEMLGTTVADFKPRFFEYAEVFQKGEIEEQALWDNICNSLNIAVPDEKNIWKKAVCKSFIDNNGTYDLLKGVKNAGFKTGFISNTEMAAVEYFHENNNQQYFDATIFSCVENTVKPEKEIYKIALEKLGLQPEEAILIDDKSENIQAAQQLKMHGIVFKNIDQVKKELSEKFEIVV